MKTTVIENFLSEDEIFDIEKTMRLNYDTVIWKEPTEHETIAHALYWYPGPIYQVYLCSLRFRLMYVRLDYLQACTRYL
jgi:hypothetical protein